MVRRVFEWKNAPVNVRWRVNGGAWRSTEMHGRMPWNMVMRTAVRHWMHNHWHRHEPGDVVDMTVEKGDMSESTTVKVPKEPPGANWN
jgi:hypothetical protein